jgi:hypothetical protein
MARSKIDIFNLALAKIGSIAISDPDGAAKGAEYCTIFYDEIRQEVLREHPWNFATKRIAFAEAAAEPDFGYDYAYSLPADCLFVRHLSEEKYKWVVESGELLTDMEGAKAIYTRDIDDPNDFDPLFVGAFATRLAAEVVAALKPQDGSKRKILWEMYEIILNRAKTANAKERKKKPEPKNAFVDARQ